MSADRKGRRNYALPPKFRKLRRRLGSVQAIRKAKAERNERWIERNQLGTSSECHVSVSKTLFRPSQ